MDDHTDDARYAWVLRTFGEQATRDWCPGADRPGSLEPRRFYGPAAYQKAARDVARGEGPRCSRCDRLRTDIRELYEGPDPYHSEINNDDTNVLLCGTCHADASDEI